MAASQPAEIQTLEEIFRLIRAAIVGKVPLTSIYDGKDPGAVPLYIGPKQGWPCANPVSAN